MAPRKKGNKKKSQKSFFKNHKAELISLAIVLFLIILNFVYKLIPMFVEQFHSRFFYKIIMVPLTYITGYLPFSLFEILIIPLIVLLIFFLIKNRKYFLKIISVTICVLFSFYTIALSMNYSRMPLDIIFDIPVMTSTNEDVAKALSFTISKLQTLVPKIEYENGVSTYNKPFSDMSAETNTTFKKLATKYDFLKGGVTFPKPLLSSKLVSYTGTCGFFSPYTFEANINTAFPSFSLPQTLCHEAAHLKGFARENEADFIGFVACVSSDDLFFQYSGYMSAFNSLGNELAVRDSSLYKATLQNIDPAILADWKEYFDYSKLHEGKIEKISSSLNDAYIKSQGDENGIQSYSNDIELIIAYIKSTSLN
ncbi:MAG: DUF3810 domain-containing protein [Clostridia bacterium]